MSKKTDTLLIRMDKIGDLVLNLPVDQHPILKNKKNYWFITKGLEFVLNHADPKRKFTSFPRDFSNFMKMFKKVRNLKPEVAVVFYAPWWVGLCLWLARVPKRIGRQSQWHSFIFFNFGVRQSRSQAEMTEHQYNMKLLEEGFKRFNSSVEGSYSTEKLCLKLISKNTQAVLKKYQLFIKEYFVVHPGMAGSALNWSPKNYIELVSQLTSTCTAVITGTKSDFPYIEPIFNDLRENKNIVWLNEKLSTDELIAILQGSKAVIAPSTGVLHLAASTGVPSIGLFSPILVQRAQRWGAYGESVINLQAESSEGQEPSLESITPSDVVHSIEKLLE